MFEFGWKWKISCFIGNVMTATILWVTWVKYCLNTTTQATLPVAGINISNKVCMIVKFQLMSSHLLILIYLLAEKKRNLIHFSSVGFYVWTKHTSTQINIRRKLYSNYIAIKWYEDKVENQISYWRGWAKWD